MARRGRSKLPRGYYLVSSAKHGGFEVGGTNTMPTVTTASDYVTVGGMGQQEFTQSELDIIAAAQEQANKTGEKLTVTLEQDPASGLVTRSTVVYPQKTVMKKLAIGAAIAVAAYFGAKATGLIGD